MSPLSLSRMTTPLVLNSLLTSRKPVSIGLSHASRVKTSREKELKGNNVFVFTPQDYILDSDGDLWEKVTPNVNTMIDLIQTNETVCLVNTAENVNVFSPLIMPNASSCVK